MALLLQRLGVLLVLGGVLALLADHPAAAAAAAPRKNDVVPFIIGGNDTVPGEFPEMVSIQIAAPSGDFLHLCGGFLISKDWVITAGHCMDQVDPSVVSVLAGATDISQPDMNSARVSIATYEIHEDYDPTTNGISVAHDIALINLASSLPLNAYIQEATLQNVPPKPGAKAEVAGWGQTENGDATGSSILQWTTLEILSKEDCQQAMDGLAPILDDQICAASSDGLEAECRGDSGGALMVDKAVVGLVSWSKKPCGKFPGVYSSIPAQYAWIRERSGLDYL